VVTVIGAISPEDVEWKMTSLSTKETNAFIEKYGI